MERAGELDLALSGDWIEIAARLVWLKSRSLLPADPELVRRDPHDPAAAELVRLLRRHARAAARVLARRKSLADACLGRVETQDPAEDDLDGVFTMGDLIRLCEAHARDSKPKPIAPALIVPVEEASVEESIQWIRSRLNAAASVPLDSLFADRPKLSNRICSFLASLELARREVELSQDDPDWTVLVVRRRASLSCESKG